ncbi:hypothetical protein N0V93_008660 [Gnomoniopsis smithogilvyi]|uniref:FAD-binding domain-containing protein n=1 Tax=Gnomoniopsis smithogilvyi TaxID=1191159 RepID=A0A9W8YM47_9PEZI|nr:hypothetical protein N0V93_008660 [Gnomoniopsis smithogilvyi]
MSQSQTPLHVAIVGGGVTGLCLGIGLQARGVPFTIYERASGIQEVGAGIGLSPNAEWAMKVLAPEVHAGYERVANANGEDYFQWVNGETKELIFKLFVGEGCFRGCRRSDFLEELVKCLPAERLKFGMMVEDVREEEEGAGMVLRFAGGREEFADTVIGSDGIRSRLRAQLFPSSAATYTQKYSFRALIPMEQALARLGHHMVSTRFMYNGPDAHIITYPVAGNTFLNTLAVVSDPQPWSAPGGRHTGRATRDEAMRAFAGWHADVKAIVELLPEDMDKWAIFDMLENPIQQYHKGGRVCLTGDAAHAVGPHLGAGAGFGIEDACLLAELLKIVQDQISNAGEERLKEKYLEAAFRVYTEMRYERTQWLVKHTRETVDLFEWRDPEVAKDSEAYGREISWRFHEIWDYNIDDMLKKAKTAVLALFL